RNGLVEAIRRHAHDDVRGTAVVRDGLRHVEETSTDTGRDRARRVGGLPGVVALHLNVRGKDDVAIGRDRREALRNGAATDVRGDTATASVDEAVNGRHGCDAGAARLRGADRRAPTKDDR